MIRDLTETDLPIIAKLLKGLGYNSSLPALEDITKQLADNAEYKVLLDAEDDAIVGLIALHTMSLFHRPGKIGRITTLVVDESYRGNRAGKMLLDASDEFFRAAGCTSCEAAGGVVSSHLRKLFIERDYKASEQHLTKILRP